MSQCGKYSFQVLLLHKMPLGEEKMARKRISTGFCVRYANKVICFSPLAYVYCVLICLWASQGIEKQPRHILHRGNPTVRWVFLVQGIMLWTRLTGGSCSGAVARVENPELDEGPSSIRYTLR